VGFLLVGFPEVVEDDEGGGVPLEYLDGVVEGGGVPLEYLDGVVVAGGLVLPLEYFEEGLLVAGAL